MLTALPFFACIGAGIVGGVAFSTFDMKALFQLPSNQGRRCHAAPLLTESRFTLWKATDIATGEISCPYPLKFLLNRCSNSTRPTEQTC
jgi:hypothetical protein